MYKCFLLSYHELNYVWHCVACLWDKRRYSGFKLTFTEAVCLEAFGPLVSVVKLTCISGAGVGKQIGVGLGDVGAGVVTSQEVKVLQPRTVVRLGRVSLGGRRWCGRAGRLLGFRGQASELLSGGIHQVGPGWQRRTPVIILLRAKGRKERAAWVYVLTAELEYQGSNVEIILNISLFV